jgi:hypothetical protein
MTVQVNDDNEGGPSRGPANNHRVSEALVSERGVSLDELLLVLEHGVKVRVHVALRRAVEPKHLSL